MHTLGGVPQIFEIPLSVSISREYSFSGLSLESTRITYLSVMANSWASTIFFLPLFRQTCDVRNLCEISGLMVTVTDFVRKIQKDWGCSIGQ